MSYTIRVLPSPITTTDVYLAALVDEIRALRAELKPAAAPEPKDGDTVELREPKAPRPIPNEPLLSGKTPMSGEEIEKAMKRTGLRSPKGRS